MYYKELYLPEPYSKYIECVWMYSASEGVSDKKQQFWLPNGTMDLVFNLGSAYERINIFDQRHRNIVKTSALIGPMKEAVKIELGASKKVVGIRFKSYGLFAWIGIPLKELVGKTIQLNEIIGKEASIWEEKMGEAESEKNILNLVMDLFQFSYSPDKMVIDAVQQILMSKGGIKIKELSNKYPITQKTFENKFGQYIGIQAKELARIYRFNYFLVSVLRKPNDLYSLQAYNCDFFDQSHSIKEFKRFTSKPPKQFLSEYSELVEINKTSMINRFVEKY